MPRYFLNNSFYHNLVLFNFFIILEDLKIQSTFVNIDEIGMNEKYFYKVLEPSLCQQFISIK